jgi:hypothetical protein
VDNRGEFLAGLMASRWTSLEAILDVDSNGENSDYKEDSESREHWTKPKKPMG